MVNRIILIVRLRAAIFSSPGFVWFHRAELEVARASAGRASTATAFHATHWLFAPSVK
jgi:hypothetical protein